MVKTGTRTKFFKDQKNWGVLIELGINPYEVVLWNVVPWYLYKPDQGLLSNRTPTVDELDAGPEHLKSFMNLFENVEMVAGGAKM